MADEYASVAELNEHVPADLLSSISDPIKLKKLERASRWVDSIIGRRGYDVPLTTVPEDIKSAVLDIAAWDCLYFRGGNPEDPGHQIMLMAKTRAEDHIKQVARGVANISGTEETRRKTRIATVISGTARRT